MLGKGTRNMDADITDLETRLMELTRVTEELNEVVTQQANKIDLLERQIKHLHSALQEASASNSGGEGQIIFGDTPPHY